MSANAIPTPGQIAAAREAVGEIAGMVYRLQQLVTADDVQGRSCLMTEIAPLLISHIGCLSEMANLVRQRETEYWLPL